MVCEIDTPRRSTLATNDFTSDVLPVPEAAAMINKVPDMLGSQSGVCLVHEFGYLIKKNVVEL